MLIKKLLFIIVASLLWCNIVSASELKNINLSIDCYFTGGYLRHLDNSKDDYHQGYLRETRTWDGEKKPEFQLIITMKETKNDIWDGEIIYLDHNGKILFKPKHLGTIGDGDFSIDAVYTTPSKNYLETLNISQWKTANTEEIYYEVSIIKINDLNDAFSKKNKELRKWNRQGFYAHSRETICFE